MWKYQTIVGIVSVLAIGISYPVSAQTTSTAQTGSQEVSINGNDNTVYQTIYQTTINRPGRGQTKNTFSQPESHTKHRYWKNKEEKKERKEK